MASDYEEKLLHPDFTLVEAKLGCKTPQSLRELYSDRGTILRRDFTLNIPPPEGLSTPLRIKFFTPIDSSCFSSFKWHENFIIIASSGGEGIYMVDPVEKDPVLYLFKLDSHDLFSTNISLSELSTKIAPEIQV